MLFVSLTLSRGHLRRIKASSSRGEKGKSELWGPGTSFLSLYVLVSVGEAYHSVQIPVSGNNSYVPGAQSVPSALQEQCQLPPTHCPLGSGQSRLSTTFPASPRRFHASGSQMPSPLLLPLPRWHHHLFVLYSEIPGSRS